MSIGIYSEGTAKIIEVKKLEREVINVDERINHLLHAITNMGIKSFEKQIKEKTGKLRKEREPGAYRFRNDFWQRIEQERKVLKEKEMRWKEAVDKANAAYARRDVPDALHHRALAAQIGAEYETYLFNIAAQVLEALGRNIRIFE